MLRRVVVENYIIFKGRQEVNFSSKDECSFYTLVGENSSGKSSFVALIKAASDFTSDVTDFEVISDEGEHAEVVCEFEFQNGRELKQFVQGSYKSGDLPEYSSFISGLCSWFADDILRLPHNLSASVSELFGTVSLPIRVVSGCRQTSLQKLQFLYILSEDHVLVVTKDAGRLCTGLHQPLPAGVDPISWVPDTASPQKMKLVESFAVQDHAGGMEESANAASGSQGHSGVTTLASLTYGELKKLTLASLLRGVPKKSLGEIQSLFQEIVGDRSIVFQISLVDNLPAQIIYTHANRVMQRIPEGLFSAFILAILVVKPLHRTIILDEPTRGMHPLQIRRLRSILMRESVNRHKCIIATTHSPEMVQVERIRLIWRFQVLPCGFCRIQRVLSHYNKRELHFIGGAEVREIFFARHIVWVEGETDKRFIESLLQLMDEGRRDLFQALLQPGAAEEKESDPHFSVPFSSNPFMSRCIEVLLQHPVYNRQYFTKEGLAKTQEVLRSCIVLALGGKKNISKATAICRDLGVPHVVICDLDAIVPNNKENSVESQFKKCGGDWYASHINHAKTSLVNEEMCPASKCVYDTDPGTAFVIVVCLLLFPNPTIHRLQTLCKYGGC